MTQNFNTNNCINIVNDTVDIVKEVNAGTEVYLEDFLGVRQTRIDGCRDLDGGSLVEEWYHFCAPSAVKVKRMIQLQVELRLLIVSND